MSWCMAHRLCIDTFTLTREYLSLQCELPEAISARVSVSKVTDKKIEVVLDLISEHIVYAHTAKH
jgi:hypothetical protein